MDLLDMVQPVKAEKKEKKEKEKPAKKESKGNTVKKEVKKTSDEEEYKFPFVIYLAAEKKDVSHIFEEGEIYSGEEITKAMLEHGYYEFAGQVTYDYMEDDNVLVPTFQQHKKG